MRNEKTKGESEKAKNMKEKDTDRKTKEICGEIIQRILHLSLSYSGI